MRPFAAFFLAATALSPTASPADPLYLFGRVGAAPALAILERDEAVLRGRYIYLDRGGELRLEGAIAATGAFHLDERADASKTGRFEGEARGDKWTGTWRKPDGTSPLAFALTETHGAPADLSGAFRCRGQRRDKEFGWTYAHSLRLTLTHAAVKAFDASLVATSTEGEQQGCTYSLKDFREVPSDIGLLLDAKDVDDPLTKDSQRCTIRILADADHVFVQFGDVTQGNDDCRFSGTTAFCSPRSWMADLIVDRRTGRCRPVGG